MVKTVKGEHGKLTKATSSKAEGMRKCGLFCFCINVTNKVCRHVYCGNACGVVTIWSVDQEKELREPGT